jgi:hypothetical protein
MPSLLTRTSLALAAGALVLVALRPDLVRASDHQDTPEVELSQRMDVNDVYAFPGASADRIVLAMSTASPVTPAQAAGGFAFDPNLLYQLKVDNNGDAVEDYVFQITFEGTGASQRVRVRGPVRPNAAGQQSTLVATGPEVTGPTNAPLGAASGVQVFAGLRDDPFWIDLEQFFRILPDRKPVSGPLSRLPDTPTASSWRNPGVDFLRGLNALAIVVELPTAQLTAGGTSKLGIWGTISR